MFPDEKALVIGIKQSNVKAFEEIFSLYHKRIYNFCLKLLPSANDAEEAVQKVFIALWEQRHQLDENKSFSAYIYSIARYTAYQDFKRLAYQKATFEQLENKAINFHDTEKDEVLFEELSQALNNIIDHLPSKRRQIFRLSRFYSLTYLDIANKLSISENTVDTQIRRALDFIRIEYKKLFK
jgi:RNA polymerase sigma-70 factor (ECF subfamily)